MNRGYVTAGVLFLALSAVLGGLLLGRRGDTATVWAAARDLPASHVLTEADLRRLSVGADVDLAAVPADVLLDGRVLRVPVVAGSPILPSALLEVGDTFAAAGRSEVGVRLGPGRVPTDLRRGDGVLVVEVPVVSSEPVLAGSVPATVVSFEVRNGDPFEPVLVTLAVDADEAEAVARGAALDRVAVVLTGRG